MATISIDGNDFDVYATVATADVYLLGSLNYSTWAAANNAEKERYLISATRFLDGQSWAADYDTFAERAVVSAIINASIEIAEQFSLGETDLFGSSYQTEVKRLKADSVEVENFKDLSLLISSNSTKWPPRLLNLLRPFLSSNSSSIAAGAYSTGTDGAAISDDSYGLTT